VLQTGKPGRRACGPRLQMVLQTHQLQDKVEHEGSDWVPNHGSVTSLPFCSDTNCKPGFHGFPLDRTGLPTWVDRLGWPCCKEILSRANNLSRKVEFFPPEEDRRAIQTG
jgi:hypothetical protein